MHGVGCCRRARPGEEGRPGSRLTEDVLGGKLIPVPVMRSPGGPPFRVSGRAGPGARVNRILDWQRCPLLEEGDLIVKLNGADVRGLSSGQVEGLLQEHLPADDVVLLVRREAPRRQAPTHREPSCSRSPESPTCSPLCSPCTPRRRRLSQPPSAKGKPWLRPSEPPPEPPGAPDHPPTPFHPPGARAPAPEAVEVTSFMDPEPRDVPWCPWRGRGPGPPRGASGQRTLDAPDGRGWEARGLGALTEVVLRRREDEGFGIVLVTEEMAAGSLVSQRIAKVRQGSPAQRSEGLQVGDRLEGVGGRSIFGAAPRDIGDLFRRAGTTLRLRILPHGETGASCDSDAADIEVNDSRMPHCVPMVSSRGPISQQGAPDPAWSTSRPQESGRYVVELHRGPKGFGFSLRGGSEHNMDIFVLGLMEGGPAQRSGKIQVSDQLMEINGQPTGGMTHAQAVEHIRNGGSRISLVLRRGNGAVPGYGRGRASDGSGPEGDAGRGPPPPSPAPRPRARPRPGPGRSDRAAEERATPREPRGDKPGPGARSREGEGETEAPGARDPGRRATLETSPGPWLVPSKERVSQALRSPGCPQKDPRRSGGTPAKAGRPEGGVESQTGPLPAASLGLGHTSAPARAVEEAVLPL
ncbi:PDZ domain-containing protein MAGIX [Ornithorhynchus anatinus]|uniref:PDZ domain-containing protein MAGIX n=1 Tax=Ornithorhynchus anatinus TaxID=9258 RepID=UPI000454B03D|nr:PDZ domain-containing protein MAGIX [Ornithorhynchus anatinus]